MATQRPLNTLQAGRGLSALAVLLFHANQTLSLPKYLGSEPAPVFRWGNSGVQYFFVLSGFVILLAHRRDIGSPATIVSFAWKRVRRVYPPLWITLLLVLAISMVVPSLHLSLSFASLATAFSILPGARETLLGPEWTLRHEVLFYAAFATLLLNRRLGAVILGAWFAASVYLMVWPLNQPTAIGDAGRSLISPAHLLFGYGMLACVAFTRGWLRRRAATTVMVAGASLFVVAAVHRTLVNAPLFDVWDQVFGIAAAMLVAGLVVVERDRGLRVPSWLVRLGEASYAIYLIHDPVVSAMAKLTSTHRTPLLTPVPLFALTSAVALCAGIAFHLVCERPLLKLLPSRR